jgi:glucose/mannose transport system substrate-binding protein
MGTMMGRTMILTTSLLLAGLGAVGCGSSASPASGTGGTGGAGGEQVIEIFSWWIAPGEAEALQALVDVNKTQHPGDRIFNAAAASGDSARALLKQRLTDHTPPDLFQQNAHDIPAFLAANPGSLQPLDDFFSAHGFDTAMLPDVINDVRVGGKIYAMPVNIHRENTLFYNKQIFADHHLAPPTTIAEFLSVCAALKSVGITPVATAYQGWILRIMFNSLAMGSMGPDAFHTFMTGGARNDAALKTAIDVMGNVLENYVNASATGTNFGWTDAATEVSSGRAAMFFHGDWAKGYYVQLGSTPGVDFGVVGAPGASDLFWYGVDSFSLPVGAQHVDGAKDFLTTIGSTAGQVAFNKLKGSTPVRPDVPRDQLDSEGRATLTDLQNARFRTLVVGKDIWDAAMLDFATTRNKDALFQVYVDNPPSP